VTWPGDAGLCLSHGDLGQRKAEGTRLADRVRLPPYPNPPERSRTALEPLTPGAFQTLASLSMLVRAPREAHPLNEKVCARSIPLLLVSLFLTTSPSGFGSSFSDTLAFPLDGSSETGKMSRLFQLTSTFFPFRDDSCFTLLKRFFVKSRILLGAYC
jgi:hypothetical protein